MDGPLGQPRQFPGVAPVQGQKAQPQLGQQQVVQLGEGEEGTAAGDHLQAAFQGQVPQRLQQGVGHRPPAVLDGDGPGGGGGHRIPEQQLPLRGDGGKEPHLFPALFPGGAGELPGGQPPGVGQQLPPVGGGGPHRRQFPGKGPGGVEIPPGVPLQPLPLPLQADDLLPGVPKDPAVQATPKGHHLLVGPGVPGLDGVGRVPVGDGDPAVGEDRPVQGGGVPGADQLLHQGVPPLHGPAGPGDDGGAAGGGAPLYHPAPPAAGLPQLVGPGHIPLGAAASQEIPQNLVHGRLLLAL